MIRITKRQFQIIDYLYCYKDSNLKQLCQKLNITPQTVKAELLNLTELFDSYEIGVSIEKNGDFLITGSRDRFIELTWEASNGLEFSMENKILLILILADDFMTLQDIADGLFVSKSYVEKQIPDVLKKYKDQIITVRHYGVKFEASQFDRRNYFVKLLFPYLSGADFSKKIKIFSEMNFPIIDYIGEKNLEIAERFLFRIQEDYNLHFTDIWLRQLYLVLVFTIWNGSRKNPEYVENGLYSQVEKSANSEKYLNAVKELNKEMNLQLPMSELYYLAYYIIISRKNKNVVLETLEEEVNQYVNEILVESRKQYSIDLSEDEDFIKRLSNHIYMLLLQGRQTAVDINWNGIDIRRQYPLSFELAVLAGNILSSHTGWSLKNSEIDYLIMHFQIALEHMKEESRRIRTVIVCHYGWTAAELIRTKVERKFPEIEIVGIYSYQGYFKLENKDFELVLSTEKLPESKQEIIYVAAVLEEDELNKIARFVKHKSSGNILLMKLMESEIIPIDDFKSNESIIEGMTDLLVKQKYVIPEYKESVLKRERLSLTNMNHIAMPHGDPSFVIESKLLIGRRKEGIQWGDSLVNCVFIFAFSKNIICVNSTIFSDFYRKLAMPGVEEKIAQLSNVDDKEFKKMLVNIFME